MGGFENSFVYFWCPWGRDSAAPRGGGVYFGMRFAVKVQGERKKV